jgi:hypothetical protein
VHPHRFRHHFSHTWLDRGGDGGDLMELKRLELAADADPVRHERPRCPRRRTYDRIMEDSP